MLNFLKKKDVDKIKVKAFAEWFNLNEERIRNSVENRENDRNTMFAVLDEVELQLGKVYRDGYNGRIEFDYGGTDQDWELNLYHKNNKFLMEATKMIQDEFDSFHSTVWKINTSR